MGTTYTTTLNLQCVKEHTCSCCGGAYQYDLRRKIQGTGGSAAVSQKNAAKNFERALKQDVDVHPCPTCGLVQADMVAQGRHKTHKLVFWLALVAAAAVLITRAAYGVNADTATWAALAVVGVAAAVHLAADLKNPNRDLAANRAAAQAKVTDGKLGHVRPGRLVSGTEEEAARFGRPMLHLAALVMLPAAVALVLWPEGLRAKNAWPLNDATYPPVAGPGDTVRIYMGQKIESVKGYWRGRPRATVAVMGGPPATAVEAPSTTNDNNWGDNISVKSSEKRSNSTPYVNVTLPGDPSLAGKTVDCRVNLDVTYPEISSSGHSFANQHKRLTHGTTLRLANQPLAGAAYDRAWWTGTAGGAGLLLVAGLLLMSSAKSLAGKAIPTRVLMPAQPAAGGPIPGRPAGR